MLQKIEKIKKSKAGLEVGLWGFAIESISKEDLPYHRLDCVIDHVESELTDLIGKSAWTHSVFKHAYYGLVYQLYVDGLGWLYYTFNGTSESECDSDCDKGYDSDCDKCDGFCEWEDCTCECHIPYCGETWRHVFIIKPLNDGDLWDAIKGDILVLSDEDRKELKELPDLAVKESHFYENYIEITREVM